MFCFLFFSVTFSLSLLFVHRFFRYLSHNLRFRCHCVFFLAVVVCWVCFRLLRFVEEKIAQSEKKRCGKRGRERERKGCLSSKIEIEFECEKCVLPSSGTDRVFFSIS